MNRVYPHWKVSDLRTDLIDKARGMAVLRKQLFDKQRHPWADMSNEELLRTSGLILTDEQGRTGITLAAVLLFGTDKLFITLLTAFAIFLIVAITFRSIFVPAILVLLVQCGIFITVTVTGIISGGMYYLALLIVECILMGATIDYTDIQTHILMQPIGKEIQIGMLFLPLSYCSIGQVPLVGLIRMPRILLSQSSAFFMWG